MPSLPLPNPQIRCQPAPQKKEDCGQPGGQPALGNPILVPPQTRVLGTHPPRPPVSEPELAWMAPKTSISWGGWCPAERAPDSPQITLTKGQTWARRACTPPPPAPSLGPFGGLGAMGRDRIPGLCFWVWALSRGHKDWGSQVEQTERWERDPPP